MRFSYIVFAVSAAWVLYVLIGYPICLGLIAKWNSAPITKEWKPRTVTIILPVFNGERWIRQKLESILALDYPPGLMDIVVVSDGSTDGTEEAVRQFTDSRILLLNVPRGGKARALNSAISQSRGDILFFTDVRQKLHPGSLRHLVSCFGDSTVGVASGELVLAEGASESEASSGLYWRYEKWIRKQLSSIGSVPGATGAIYAMRRELAIPIPEEILVDDMFLPISAFLKGFRVILDDAAYAYDQPMALKTEFRRKVRTLAGVYQLIAIYPELLYPRTRMWFHFISHKAGRLTLPWALLANLISSFYLPDKLRLLALALHCCVYGLAALDFVIPEGILLKRLTSPARTFVALMIAAMCAVAVFFIPSDRFWRTATSSAPSGAKD